MNPVVIIPTYWTARQRRNLLDLHAVYDHATMVGQDGTLVDCLTSLRGVNGLGRIILLVVAEAGADPAAGVWVRSIAARFPNLDIVTIADGEMEAFHLRLRQLGIKEFTEGLSLHSYGSIRNVGFALAALLGHDVAVFLDDDEIILTPDFLEVGCYGLGGQTKHGIPVLVKSGYFLNANNSFKAPVTNHWYDMAWKQNELFNRYISQAMRGSRLSRSNTLSGGLMAVHYEAFRRVSFDPWIPRGEDLDYLINLRMYGLETWLDNQWSVCHRPPNTTDESLRFRQDVYRWIYQHRKIEYGRTQIDLLQVKADDLQPYPGPFLESSITTRIFFTALLRSIARPSRQNYLHIAFQTRKEATDWAARNCRHYFEFQYRWPEVIALLERDEPLIVMLEQARLGAATPQSITSSSPFPDDQDDVPVESYGSGDTR